MKLHCAVALVWWFIRLFWVSTGGNGLVILLWKMNMEIWQTECFSQPLGAYPMCQCAILILDLASPSGSQGCDTFGASGGVVAEVLNVVLIEWDCGGSQAKKKWSCPIAFRGRLNSCIVFCCISEWWWCCYCFVLFWILENISYYVQGNSCLDSHQVPFSFQQ